MLQRTARSIASSLEPDAADLADALASADGDRRDETPSSRLPVIVYGDDADDTADGAWKRLGGDVHRPPGPLRRPPARSERPSSCTATSPSCPKPSGRCSLDLHQSDKILAGKKVLIVDDDMRNIFALSTVLEEHDMVIVSADNGRDAIRHPAGATRRSTSC